MKILTKDAKQMVNGPYYCPNAEKNYSDLCNLKTKEVFAVCKCGLEWQVTYAPVFQPIDYYNKFRDAMEKAKLWDHQTEIDHFSFIDQTQFKLL